jgi:hypothetical protein
LRTLRSTKGVNLNWISRGQTKLKGQKCVYLGQHEILGSNVIGDVCKNFFWRQVLDNSRDAVAG